MSVSNVFAAAALGAALGTPDTTIYYLGLTAGGVELDAEAYVRQPVTFSATSGRQRTNTALVTFPAAGAGGWGSVDGWALFVDDSTPSSYLSQGTFTSPVGVPEGMLVKFAAGSITVSA